MDEYKTKILSRIKLTKLSDDEFEGNHPNGIYEGHTEIGYISELPKIGDRFYVGQFSTSIVKEELNDINIFKTTYSTYRIEFLK